MFSGSYCSGIKARLHLEDTQKIFNPKVPEVFKMKDPVFRLLPTTLVVASPKLGC